MDAVPLDDRGLLLGDGLFETLLVADGRPLFLAEHLARLRRGCAALGLPAPDPDAARTLIDAAIACAGLGEGRAAARLTWTAGSGGRGLDRPAAPTPRLFASAASASARQGPATAVVAHTRRNADSPASRLKTLSYLDNVLARREASAAGADEAVMLNTRGEVACASAANLFWIKDEVLFTPALDCGVLDGITRAGVLALATARGVRIAEVRAKAAALSGADGGFLTNSLIGVRPLSHLDGGELSAHPLAVALADDWARLTRGA